MKKLVGILCLLFFVCACSNNKDDNFGYPSLDNQNHIIKQVNINEIKDRRANKDTYYLAVGRPSCPACVEAMPEYSKVAQENGLKEAFYFSFEDMAQEFMQNGQLTGQLKKDYQFLQEYLLFDGSTPQFYFIKDGKVVYTSNDINNDNLTSWRQVLEIFFKEAAKK